MFLHIHVPQPNLDTFQFESIPRKLYVNCVSNGVLRVFCLEISQAFLSRLRRSGRGRANRQTTAATSLDPFQLVMLADSDLQATALLDP